MDRSHSLNFLPPKIINSERPLLVYLPGMDGTGQLFQTQAQKLAADFDLRCLSIPVHNMSNWSDLVRETIALIKSELKRKSNYNVYLCGESFGGCLAIKVALSASSLIQKLILVNPASSFNQQPILSWGIDLTRWMPDWLHPYSTVSILPFLVQLNRIKESDRLALIQKMKSLPPQVVSWRLSLLRNFTVSEAKLRRLTIPTLFIAGAADRLLPSVKEGQKLVKILPHAQMTILPYSGHACLLETEVSLYDILVEQNFISTQTTSSVGFS